MWSTQEIDTGAWQPDTQVSDYIAAHQGLFKIGSRQLQLDLQLTPRLLSPSRLGYIYT